MTDCSPQSLLADARWLRRLSHRIIHDPLLADDVCQEALVASLRAEGGGGRSWLGGVARNIAATLTKRESRRSVVERSAEIREAASPTVELVAEAELQRAAVAALMELAEPYRSTLLLRFMKGLSVRAVASWMNVPVETVRTRQQRALVKLRKRLDCHPGDYRALVLPLVSSGWPMPCATTFWGILVMKTKTAFLGAATVLVAAILTTTWVMSDPADSTGELSPEASPLVGEATAEARVEATAGREEISGAVGTKESRGAPTTGRLLVHVFYAGDMAPASDVDVLVGSMETPRKKRKYVIVRTDERGYARFPKLRPGKFFSNTNRFLRALRFDIVAGEETAVECELNGFLLTGVVVDASGVPVANADVVLFSVSGTDGMSAARSDARGRFRIRGVGCCCIAARAPGFAPSVRQTVIAEIGEEKDVRITLPDVGGAVSGRVFDANGKGFEGAFVQIGDTRPQEAIVLEDGTQAMVAEAAHTTTNAEGRFELVGLPTGGQPVFVRAFPYAPSIGEVEVLAGRTVQWNATLVVGATCEGVVSDESGDPLEGVTVRVYAWPRAPHVARTGKDGRYRLIGLPTGSLELRVSSTEFGRAKRSVEGRSGQTVRCDFELARPSVCRGRVTDQSNKPIQGARVTVRSRWTPERKFWAKFLTTDAAGEFEVSGFPKGPLCFRVQCAEYESLEEHWIDSIRGPISLRLNHEGKATGKVVGRVVDPDGDPLAEARVWVFREGESVTGRGFSIGVQTLTPTPLGRNGEFEIERLRQGVCKLFVRAAGYPVWRSVEISLSRGETFDAGRIVLVRGGSVLFELKKPGAETSFSLVVFREGERLGTKVETRSTPIRSRPLAPGRYIARLSGGTILPRKVPFVVSAGREERLNLSVETGHSVSFRFEMPKGSIPRQLLVVLTHRDGRVFEYLPARFRGGQFLGGLGLPPGHYKLRVESAEGVGGTGEFTVTKHEPARKYVPVQLRR